MVSDHVIVPGQNASRASIVARATEILAQMAVELAFVEAGKDAGLLPINSLAMDFEELPLESAPAMLPTGLAAARAQLDKILDGTGTFSEESIRFFNDWHSWVGSLVSAWDRGANVPPAPNTLSPWIRGGLPDTTPAPASKTTSPPPPAAPLSGQEPSVQLNLAADTELLREFHSESLELLQAIEQGLLVLEEKPADAETINSIFRAFHTLKGGAGLLQLDALRELAHDLESLLDAVRRAELIITSETINLVLSGADTLKQFAQEIGSQLQGVKPGEPIVIPTRALRQRLRAALAGDSSPPRRPEETQSTRSSANPQEPTAAKGVAPEGSPPAAPPAKGPVKTPHDASARTERTESAAGFVKLDTRKLDSLVDLAGELVIAQSMIVQDPDVQQLASRHLARALRQLGRITTELQRTPCPCAWCR